MPQPKDPLHFNFRTSPAGAGWLREMAEKHDVPVAEVIKVALKVAADSGKKMSELIEARQP